MSMLEGVSQELSAIDYWERKHAAHIEQEQYLLRAIADLSRRVQSLEEAAAAIRSQSLRDLSRLSEEIGEEK